MLLPFFFLLVVAFEQRERSSPQAGTNDVSHRFFHTPCLPEPTPTTVRFEVRHLIRDNERIRRDSPRRPSRIDDTRSQTSAAKSSGISVPVTCSCFFRNSGSGIQHLEFAVELGDSGTRNLRFGRVELEWNPESRIRNFWNLDSENSE